MIEPSQSLTDIIQLLYCYITTFWTLFRYSLLNTVSQSWVLPLGTSFSGSKGLILTGLSPAGAPPLAMTKSKTINEKFTSKTSKSSKNTKLSALLAKQN